MYILHSVLKKDFDITNKYYGEESIKRSGFIHCSDLYTYKLVAPNFRDEEEERILLVIDTDKVDAEIKWEDGGGLDFPHIYGLLNTDSIVEVLPHEWSGDKVWIPDKRLEKYSK